MIELNLTYVESKKILELGYDFSKVCWKSSYEYRDQHNLNKKFISMYLHGTGSSSIDIEDGIKHRMSKYGVVGLVTPVIPKAALEACLPDRLQIETQKLGYTEIEECYPGKELGYGQYNYWYSSNGKPFNSRCFKDGVYEAFLWCHENYPEELKKKFDEVMA
jgi:hypothetical protein